MKAIVVGVLSVVGATSCFADEKSCLTAAFQDHLKAGLALHLQNGMNLSVEGIIAERRLEEQFCIRTAGCLAGPDQPWVAKVSPNLAKQAYAVEFGRCLDDEAKERLNK